MRAVEWGDQENVAFDLMRCDTGSSTASLGFLRQHSYISSIAMQCSKTVLSCEGVKISHRLAHIPTGLIKTLPYIPCINGLSTMFWFKNGWMSPQIVTLKALNVTGRPRVLKADVTVSPSTSLSSS